MCNLHQNSLFSEYLPSFITFNKDLILLRGLAAGLPTSLYFLDSKVFDCTGNISLCYHHHHHPVFITITLIVTERHEELLHQWISEGFKPAFCCLAKPPQ